MVPVINKAETGINLRKMMDRRQLSVEDVREYLELGSVQSIYHWLNGISMPTIDNLYALSELFQVPIDDMICGNRVMAKRCDAGTEPGIERFLVYYNKIYGKDVA